MMIDRNLIQSVVSLPTEQQMFLKLKEDRYFNKIPEKDYSKILEKAKVNGEKLAREIKEKYGSVDMVLLAEIFNLQVKREVLPIEEDFISIGYFQKPNKIGINQKMKENDELFLKEGLEWLTSKNWEQVVIAHEIYHFLGNKEKSGNYQVPLWKLGFY